MVAPCGRLVQGSGRSEAFHDHADVSGRRQARVQRRGDRCPGRRRDLQIARPEGGCGRGRRQAARSRRPDPRRCAGADPHARGCRRAGADPPRLRARAGGGGAGAVSRHPGDDRPGDRGRLLLRLRARRAVHARRLRRRSRSGCARSSIATSRSPARSGTRCEAIALLREHRRELTRPRSSTTIPAGEAITLYRQGDWVDLCRGPHLPSTGKLRQGVQADQAGRRLLARRSAATPMLQRIYGTAWAHPKQISTPISQLLEEAEKRDHRRLGREMDLFHMQEEGRASVFWHPKGWTLCRALEDYMRRAAGRGRLCRGATRRRCSTARSGRRRATGRSIRDNMFVCETRGRRDAGAEADELPGPRADLQARPQELPRPAAADGRVRRLPPLRAVRRAARADAGARLHPGRRAHLLPRGPDRRGDAGVHRPDRGRSTPTSASRTSSSSSPTGRRRAPARTRPGTRPKRRCMRGAAHRPASRPAQPGRRRLLRAEARLRAARRDRPRLAAAARCSSITCCRSGWTPTTSARTARSTGR